MREMRKKILFSLCLIRLFPIQKKKQIFISVLLLHQMSWSANGCHRTHITMQVASKRALTLLKFLSRLFNISSEILCKHFIGVLRFIIIFFFSLSLFRQTPMMTLRYKKRFQMSKKNQKKSRTQYPMYKDEIVI